MLLPVSMNFNLKLLIFHVFGFCVSYKDCGIILRKWMRVAGMENKGNIYLKSISMSYGKDERAQCEEGDNIAAHIRSSPLGLGLLLWVML